MKFCKNGPDIPDSLLWRRDADEVVFVCGAGVSMGKANLPDFVTLVDKVMDKLLVIESNRARKILDFVKTSEHAEFIPIDQIFGQLQIDYSDDEIEDAVSELLHTPKSIDISHHKIVYDLARTRNGNIRLITTNFDDLFSKAIPPSDFKKHKDWVYPKLPPMKNGNHFSGLVYLHGKCYPKDQEKKGKLILSPSSYGKAYVLKKKITKFLKKVLKKYTVVFLGYSADDPPMRYLLEALANSGVQIQDAYAFQKGTHQDVINKWERMNVTPITFEEYDDLWKTLDLWATRAKDCKKWVDRVLRMAKTGPMELDDWQRSQVVHLASHKIGAKAIASSRVLISAQWLYCFDPLFRYAKPILVRDAERRSLPYDPFSKLGLPEDVSPEVNDQHDIFSCRKIPENAKNMITPNNEEIQEQIFIWISRILEKPETVRWAYHQNEIDQKLKQKIIQNLYKKSKKIHGRIADAWEHLLINWKNSEHHTRNRMIELESQVQEGGWCSKSVEVYQEILAPFLERKPPQPAKTIRQRNYRMNRMYDISIFNIISPSYKLTEPIPAEWIYEVLQKDKYNLNLALELEKSYGYPRISRRMPSICRSSGTILEEDYGVSVAAFRYLDHFMELVEHDEQKAEEEFNSWPQDDTGVYGRFRIWAAGNCGFLSAEAAADILIEMPDLLFWEIFHRRDLLDSLKRRWKSFSLQKISCIEKRILSRNSTYYSDRRRTSALMPALMLQWLSDHDCIIGSDSRRRISESPSYSESEGRLNYTDADIFYDAPLEFEKTDVDYKIFLNVYVDQIVDISKEYSNKNVESYVTDSPFESLCNKKPARALAALRRKAGMNEYPSKEWSAWLNRSEKDDWTERKLYLTTAVLLRTSDEWLEQERFVVYRWFECVSGYYTFRLTDIRDLLFFRLVGVLKRWPSSCSSPYARRSNRIDWVREADCSPPGYLARGILKYHEFRYHHVNHENPSQVDYWLESACSLLSLGGEGGCYAMICLVGELGLLNDRFPEWTKNNLLYNNDISDKYTLDSYWSGISNSNIECLGHEIFRSIATSFVDHIIGSSSARVSQYQKLIPLLVLGWLRRDQGRRIVSNKDLCHILTTDSTPTRVGVLRVLKDYSLSTAPHEGVFDWSLEFTAFFSDVWPRTNLMKTHETTKYMLEIIFSSAKVFDHVSRIVFSRLGKLESDKINFGDLSKKGNGILKRDADFVLDILKKSLEGVSYSKDSEINIVLDLIEEQYSFLGKDSRMESLRAGRSK